jgi:hypothetical protein
VFILAIAIMINGMVTPTALVGLMIAHNTYIMLMPL